MCNARRDFKNWAFQNMPTMVDEASQSDILRMLSQTELIIDVIDFLSSHLLLHTVVADTEEQGWGQSSTVRSLQVVSAPPSPQIRSLG